MIAARHAQVAEHELRKECQVEADEDDQCGQPCPPFRVHPPRHFGPPEMDAAHVRHDRTAHHDVMKMGNHKIGIVDVDIDS